MSARTFELFKPKKKKFGNVEVQKGFCYGAGFGLPNQTTSWNVYLWNNLVAIVCMEDVDSLNVHHVKLYSRGYSTHTTLTCINNVLSKIETGEHYSRVHQYHYDWYYGRGAYYAPDRKKCTPFFEGIAVTPDGKVLNPEKAPVITKPKSKFVQRLEKMHLFLVQVSKYNGKFGYIPGGTREAEALKNNWISVKENQMYITIEGRFQIVKLKNQLLKKGVEVG